MLATVPILIGSSANTANEKQFIADRNSRPLKAVRLLNEVQ